MNCKKCGNKNPDYARFCVFCGEEIAEKARGAEELPLPPKHENTSVHLVEPAVDIKAEKQRNVPTAKHVSKAYAPAARAGQAKNSVAVTKTAPRARPGTNVKPIAENPAQPARPSRAASASDEKEQAGKAPAAKSKPSTMIPKKTAGASPPVVAAADEAVNGSGDKEKIPPRRVPVMKDQRKGAKPNTIVPERERKKSGRPGFGRYDDEEEEYEDALKHKILSAIAGVFLLLAFCVAFWLIVTPSGQVFRAGLGLSAPADAYKQLGDNLRKNAQFTKAADAYYNALKLESDNFEYALLVGKTQEVIGNHEKAESAYWLCIQLKEDEAEPYQLLYEMYVRQGKADQADAVRQMGSEKTGDDQFGEDVGET